MMAVSLSSSSCFGTGFVRTCHALASDAIGAPLSEGDVGSHVIVPLLLAWHVDHFLPLDWSGLLLSLGVCIGIHTMDFPWQVTIVLILIGS